MIWAPAVRPLSIVRSARRSRVDRGAGFVALMTVIVGICAGGAAMPVTVGTP